MKFSLKTKAVSFFAHYWILILVIAVKLILQFAFVNPVYELHRDEFLHLDQAFHPAAGYISVPPFTSWMAGLIYIFGGDLFWVRLIPALFGALTIIFAWLIVEETGGGLYAKVLTSVFLIFSVFTRMNVLFQPNSFDILAWTMVFFFLIKYNHTSHPKWLMILAVIIALGLYNKYNIMFLVAGLFTGLLFTPQRLIFTRKIFYISMVLCLILFLPNIIWQTVNGFPVVRHMEALNDSQLVNISRADFLLDQFKYGLIGILTLAAFLALLFFKPFRQYRFIGWTFIAVIALYTLSRAKSYYSIGLYPVMFAIGSVWLEVILKRLKHVVIPLIAILNVFIFFVIVKFLMPYQSPEEIILNRQSYERMGLLRWEDGVNHPLPQDFSDMLGWQEMADKALTAYKMIPVDELDNTLVFCDNYGQTGALNYYNKTKMTEAYSFNTDYIWWLPDMKVIKNVVLVGDRPDNGIIEMFSAFQRVGTVENEYARENGTAIWLMTGASPEFTEVFYKMAERRREEFDIF